MIMEKVTLNTNHNLVREIKKIITSYGGYMEICDEDIEELITTDVGFSDDGESHYVLSMDMNGIEMDNGDYCVYEDLTPTDLNMLIDYAKWKLTN